MKRSFTLASAVAVIALGMGVPVRAQTTGMAADFRSADTSDLSVVYAEVTHAQSAATRALMGVSEPQPQWGVGVEGIGGFQGVFGSATVSGAGIRYGVYGLAGFGDVNYSVFGKTSGTVGTSYAGYFDGDVTVTGTFTNPSDLKFKEDLATLDTSLSKLMDLEVVTYEHKREPEFSRMNLPEGPQAGFIAQQVAEVFPELVTEAVHPANSDLDGRKGVPGAEAEEPVRYLALKPLQMIPLLVKAIQEQQVEIEALKAQLGPLQRRLAALETADAEEVALASMR